MALENKIEFGTAGIRGKLGPGESYLNEAHAARLADAYANYLLNNFKDAKKRGIVVGRDNRQKSIEFSQIFVTIFNSYGIRVFFNKELVPTPFISYNIRKFKTCGGINITASHNPKEYNGIKVYNQTGSQLLPKATEEIKKYYKEYNKYISYNENFVFDKNLLKSENVTLVSKQVFDDYIAEIFSLAKNKNLDLSNLKVAYSPQHGTGAKFAKQIFKKLKVQAFYEEKEMVEDPNFTYSQNPNPEDPKAYLNVKKIAKENKTDLIIVTDPDSDRVGLCVLDKKTNEYKLLTGNETAILQMEYLIENKAKLDKNNIYYMIYSFVSSSLPNKMAKENNIISYKTATGFKWIGNLIEVKKQNRDKEKFLFAFEESYGSLVNENISRDKDAIQSIFFISLVAAFYKEKNLTLLDVLDNVYHKYGYVKSQTINIDLNSFEEIDNYMSKFKNIKFDIDSNFIDYSKGINDIYPSAMFSFEFANDSWVSIRPSGTEPKMKIYILFIDKDEAKAQQLFESAKKLIIKELNLSV